jgi:hypothetical protein
MKRISVVIFFFLVIKMASAEDLISSSLFDKAEANVHYGFIIPHDNSLNHLVKGYFPSFQLSFSGSTNGSKHWHHIYNFPELGINFLYADLAYPEVLGSVYALYPHIKIPVLRKERYSINFRHGLGVAYTPVYYHITDNYRNNAIGSSLNIFYQFLFDSDVYISNHSSFNFGIGLLHFSNGNTRKPNKGLNITTAKLGYSYKFNKTKVFLERKTEFEEFGRTKVVFAIAGGYSRIGIHRDDSAYPEFSLTSTATKKVSKKINLGIGGDVFVSYSDAAILERQNLVENAEFSDMLKAGLHFSFEQIFGDITFMVQTGIYLRAVQKSDGILYNRAGFRIQLPHNLQFQFALKTHLFRADYIETGIGYAIPLR